MVKGFRKKFVKSGLRRKDRDQFRLLREAGQPAEYDDQIMAELLADPSIAERVKSIESESRRTGRSLIVNDRSDKIRAKSLLMNK